MKERISEKEFLSRVKTVLERKGLEPYANICCDSAAPTSAYYYVARYALENQLFNTAIALPQVRETMLHAANAPGSRFHHAGTHIAYFQHCLAVCHMLIDLHISLDELDEDILLASALCHILPENIHFEDLEMELTENCHLDLEVYKTVLLIFRETDGTDAEQKIFYERVRENKLALLIKLADRGNLVEQLYGVSSWSARSYIHETRTFYFPMCIYAKAHYPELLAPVSVMMEKMRCLIEIAEILLSRYEAREIELSQEILSLQEENATISRMIQQLCGDC